MTYYGKNIFSLHVNVYDTLQIVVPTEGTPLVTTKIHTGM
jgi:hypothetical protein